MALSEAANIVVRSRLEISGEAACETMYSGSVIGGYPNFIDFDLSNFKTYWTTIGGNER